MGCIVRQIAKKNKNLPRYTQTWWLEIWKLHGNFRSLQLKHEFDSHVFVRNTLVCMYGMFKDIQASRQLFKEIPNPELMAWNKLIFNHFKYKHASSLVFQFIVRCSLFIYLVSAKIVIKIKLVFKFHSL